MINLLPPKEKEFFKKEKTKRLTIIVWSLFSFFLVCFILILIAINFYVAGKAESQEVLYKETEKMAEQIEIQQIRKKIKNFDEILSKFDSFYKNRAYFSKVLEKISGLMPKDSYLTSVFLNYVNYEKDKTELLVSMSGYIPDRESLFEFKKTLEETEDIKIPEDGFPPSNWIKATNISFSVKFQIKPH